MKPISRRNWLRRSASSAVVGSTFISRMSRAQQPDGSAPDDASDAIVDTPYVFNLPEAGRIEAVPSRSIEASPLSVGFETLDRQHFDPTKTYDQLSSLA